MNALNSPETYMERCIQMATSFLGKVAPNPLVGCVIVKEGRIIGEGIHKIYGGPHAEVNAIESVQHQEDLKDATLFVNLEPCAHHGKTPPCAEKIIAAGIGEVYFSETDPNEKVAGKGAARLREAGVIVHAGLLKKEEEELNRRFRTFHLKKRPYLILKWAQTADGFMDIDRSNGKTGSHRISNDATQSLLHQWRSEEQAILIGTNTALTDDPSLDTRLVQGKSPLRLVIDRNLRIPAHSKLLTDGKPTIVYTLQQSAMKDAVEYVQVDADNVKGDLLNDLFRREIQSVIVEGGKLLLQSFLDAGIWDEIRIFVAPESIKTGLKAPEVAMSPVKEFAVGNNRCIIYRNT